MIVFCLIDFFMCVMDIIIHPVGIRNVCKKKKKEKKRRIPVEAIKQLQRYLTLNTLFGPVDRWMDKSMKK